MQGSFFSIAENGAADDVYFLYGQGADINEIHEYGKLPLGAAAAAGNTNVVRALVELGADPDEDDHEGYTPVQYTIWGENYETLFALLEFGDDVARQKRAEFAFFKAASGGNDFLVNALLDRGLDVNLRDENGSTALIEAVERGPYEGQLAVIKTLIRRGADIHLQGWRGQTALQSVIRPWGEVEGEPRAMILEAVQLLRMAGAKLGIHEAIALDEYATTLSFLKNGADVNARNDSGETLLHIAVQYGHIEMVRLLLEQGANVSATDNYSSHALSYALVSGSNHVSIVHLLLRYGANPNQAEGSGEDTPLIEATGADMAEMVRTLLDAGAEINATNKFGYTALMIAAERNAIDAARVLLNAGADVHRENIHLGTALGYATNKGHDELAALLRAHGARLLTE